MVEPWSGGDNDEPGGVPLEGKMPFEEFLPADEQHIAVVDEEHVTAEGRKLSPGDRITPAQARREKVLFHVEPWSRKEV